MAYSQFVNLLSTKLKIKLYQTNTCDGNIGYTMAFLSFTGYIIIENTYQFVCQLQRSEIAIFMCSSCKKQYTERHGGYTEWHGDICFFGFGIAEISPYIVTLSACYYVAPSELTLHNSYLCYYYFAPTELGFYQFLGENAIPLAPQGLHHNRKYRTICLLAPAERNRYLCVFFV